MANKPTNSDIYREILTIQGTMKKFEERLRPLEDWKVAYQAATEALDKAKIPQMTGQSGTLNAAFVKVVLKVLGYMTALVGLLYLMIDKLK